ncbi:hypothetical protein A7982_12524 [Minicystis rosea]|nr:hypothetical protein A7982_12524 [Minicystis rosea]
MSESFEISYAWKQRAEPWKPFQYAGGARVINALMRFEALYEGNFTVRVAQFEAVFDLCEDLSLIFEDLPNRLTSLLVDTEEPVTIELQEQEIDAAFWLERRADLVLVELRVGTAPPGLQGFPQRVFPVAAGQFLGEWARFLFAILDVLVEIEPDLAGEESYLAYRRRVVAIESASSAITHPR